MIDDPRTEAPKVVDVSALRARRDEAEILLDEKGVFLTAVRAVRIKWYRELMATRETKVKDELVAMLRALDAVPEMMQTEISNHKMAAAKRHG